MIKIKIGGQELEALSYGYKSHTVDKDLKELRELKWETKGKYFTWYINGEKIKGRRSIQFNCVKCHNHLYSINLSRLRDYILGKDEVSFICRSCSSRKNAKKVNIDKRNNVRKENWNKKTKKELKEFKDACSDSRLNYLNVKITQKKIDKAIYEYTVNKKPLREISKILGFKGMEGTRKILQNNNIPIRTFSEARSIYLKKNPKKNPFTRPEVIEKIKEYRKNHPIIRQNNSSKAEQYFFQELYIKDKVQHQYIGSKQYDVLVNGEIYIEYDGTYWHGKTGDSYDFGQMYNMLNDEIKNDLVKEEGKSLYRVWGDEDFGTYTLDEIRDKAYYIIEDGKVVRDNREYKEVIITWEYAHKIRDKYPDNMGDNIELLLTFIRTFYEFPWMTDNHSLAEIRKKISGSNLNLNVSSHTRIGNDFLKVRFKSYYSAQKGTKVSIYEGYKDDKIMTYILNNRLGLTYKEHWDLSMATVRRGFISNYYAVSFFNPKIGYYIYNLIAKPGETILDMSCGFGGRMLGWDIFGGGKYIGYEPNKQTYDELIEFGEELGLDYEIYNKAFEDGGMHEVDLCFSCPPYFDTEIYSFDETQSLVRYPTYEEWLEKFIKASIRRMKKMSDRVYLLVNEQIKNDLECEIIYKVTNIGSHFSKRKNYEYLIKL